MCAYNGWYRLGQTVGTYTDATHGTTLSTASVPYYNYIMPYGLAKFKRFATEVWGVNADGKSDEQIAKEGIADATIVLPGGYKILNRDEIVSILKESL